MNAWSSKKLGSFCREKYCFDHDPDEALKDLLNVKYPGDFFVSPSGDTFYIKGGLNDGCRAVIHTTIDDSEFGQRRRYYVGKLWGSSLVECSAELAEEVLRGYASTCPKKLLEMDEVPGFKQEDSEYRLTTHKQGWYSESPFAIELPSPAWAPEARAFNIKEGVYLSFPDGSMRLVGRREFFSTPWNGDSKPFARQGDCLVYEWECMADAVAAKGEQAVRIILPKEASVLNSANQDGLDHHSVSLDSDGGGCLVIGHPEHEELRVKVFEHGMMSVVLMPGTSRPFQRSESVD